MRVHDGRGRGGRPSRSRPQHVDREQLVLGVGHVAERHPLPGGARDAAVGVGEEASRGLGPRGCAPRSTRGRAVGRQRARTSSRSSRAHRRAARRAAAVRAEHERDVVGEREAVEQRARASASPAGTASWVRKATCAPLARSIEQVARPAVGEALDARSPRRRSAAGELAPSRRCEPESATSSSTGRSTRWRAHRAQDVAEQRAAVAHRDRDGHDALIADATSIQSQRAPAQRARPAPARTHVSAAARGARARPGRAARSRRRRAPGRRRGATSSSSCAPRPSADRARRAATGPAC